MLCFIVWVSNVFVGELRVWNPAAMGIKFALYTSHIEGHREVPRILLDSFRASCSRHLITAQDWGALFIHGKGLV